MNSPQIERSGCTAPRRTPLVRGRIRGHCFRSGRGRSAVAGLIASLLLAAGVPDPAAARLPALPAGAAYGDYAVGVATGFAVDVRQRFDPWNTAYAGPEYRALLRRVEDAGQTRTVVFQLWYPAPPNTSRGRVAGPRSPFPAQSGRPANYYDFFFQEGGPLAQRIGAAAQVVLPQFVHLPDGGTLAEADGAVQQGTFAEIGRRILGAPRGAWQDAWPAEGKFPLILLAHGLAGSHAMWSSLGEFLASHGYVVAAPTFISDGGLPLVFHDEDSPFAKQASAEEVQRAYEVILGQIKVVPYFYRLLFGREGRGFAPPAGFNPPAETLVPGGVERATTMMRNLFRQRVSDVGLVLHTVRLLGADEDTCRTSLRSMGAISAARELADHYLCGLLNGRIDGERVGIAGHSLGAMTAQLAANHLPGVNAAIGFNNAPPFTWTPEEMFGAGEARDDGGAGGDGDDGVPLPVGSHKPVLIMIGDEDAFVQRVFAGLFQSAIAAAGGDPAVAFPLAPERAAPERMENPQPVALSAWRRAVSDRMLVIVRDTDHFTIVEDFARMFPWPKFQRGELPFGPTPERTRKPTGAQAFGPPSAEPGEPYTQLGWTTAGEAGEVYMPHVIRDWYAKAWFDWYLKGEREAHERLRSPDPFGTMTSVRKDVE